MYSEKHFLKMRSQHAGLFSGIGEAPQQANCVRVAPGHCLLLLYQIWYNSRYTKKSVIPKLRKSALTTGLFPQKFGITDFEKRREIHCQYARQ